MTSDVDAISFPRAVSVDEELGLGMNVVGVISDERDMCLFFLRGEAPVLGPDSRRGMFRRGNVSQRRLEFRCSEGGVEICHQKEEDQVETAKEKTYSNIESMKEEEQYVGQSRHRRGSAASKNQNG